MTVPIIHCDTIKANLRGNKNIWSSSKWMTWMFKHIFCFYCPELILKVMLWWSEANFIDCSSIKTKTKVQLQEHMMPCWVAFLRAFNANAHNKNIEAAFIRTWTCFYLFCVILRRMWSASPAGKKNVSIKIRPAASHANVRLEIRLHDVVSRPATIKRSPDRMMLQTSCRKSQKTFRLPTHPLLRPSG